MFDLNQRKNSLYFRGFLLNQQNQRSRYFLHFLGIQHWQRMKEGFDCLPLLHCRPQEMRHRSLQMLRPG